MRTAKLASLLILATAAACAAGEVTDVQDGPAVGAATAPRGVYVPIRAGLRPSKTNFQPGGAPLKIYMNPRGGTFRGGIDDADEGISSVVASTGRSSVTMPAYDGGAPWPELVACVQEELAAYNVTVTDEQPRGGAYIEVVVGGSGKEIGMPGYAGVAPIDTTGCRLIDGAVVFVFARELRDLRGACEATVAQIGHAASLDHTFDCTDAMSYLNGCGDRHLQDEDMACGELAERPCVCGRERQNSAEVLLEVLGPRTSGAPAPGPDECGDLDYAGQCSETGVLSWCDRGLRRTLDCAAGGLTCGDTGNEVLGNDCKPPEEVPDACGGVDFLGECTDEGVLRYCLDGELIVLDCAAIGQECTFVDDETGFYCTVPPAPSNCGEIDFFGECSTEGQVLTYCSNGELRVVDCAAQGDVCGLIDDTVGFGCTDPPPPAP